MLQYQLTVTLNTFYSHSINAKLILYIKYTHLYTLPFIKKSNTYKIYKTYQKLFFILGDTKTNSFLFKENIRTCVDWATELNGEVVAEVVGTANPGAAWDRVPPTTTPMGEPPLG